MKVRRSETRSSTTKLYNGTHYSHTTPYGTAWYDSQTDGAAYAGKVAYDYITENTSIKLKSGTTATAGGAFSVCEYLTIKP